MVFNSPDKACHRCMKRSGCAKVGCDGFVPDPKCSECIRKAVCLAEHGSSMHAFCRGFLHI